jgi:hypothetical protein
MQHVWKNEFFLYTFAEKNKDDTFVTSYNTGEFDKYPYSAGMAIRLVRPQRGYTHE